MQVHHWPCTSSAAAAAAAPPKPLSFWYGTSLATVREVAATGKLCVMSLDMQGAEVRVQDTSNNSTWLLASCLRTTRCAHAANSSCGTVTCHSMDIDNPNMRKS